MHTQTAYHKYRRNKRNKTGTITEKQSEGEERKGKLNE